MSPVGSLWYARLAGPRKKFMNQPPGHYEISVLVNDTQIEPFIEKVNQYYFRTTNNYLDFRKPYFQLEKEPGTRKMYDPTKPHYFIRATTQKESVPVIDHLGNPRNAVELSIPNGSIGRAVGSLGYWTRESKDKSGEAITLEGVSFYLSCVQLTKDQPKYYIDNPRVPLASKVQSIMQDNEIPPNYIYTDKAEELYEETHIGSETNRRIVEEKRKLRTMLPSVPPKRTITLP